MLFFLTSLITITGFMFLLKHHISHIQIIFSFVVSCICLFVITKKEKVIYRVLPVLLFLIFISVVIPINANYIDVSWDGNSYHKDAIGALKNGWNPVYEDYLDFYKKADYRDNKIIGKELVGCHGFWQTYYAKGAWYVNANFYYLLDNIESSKMFNPMILYITLIISINFISIITKRKSLSILIGLLFAFSPTVIPQLFTNYNDGALYCTLLCLLMELVLFVFKKTNNSLFNIFCLIIICSNIKFTGLGYEVIMGLGIYFVYLWFNRKNLKKIIKPTIVFVSAILFSILVVGYQPYVTNTLSKGHPLYPLAGSHKVDIVSKNQPSSFTNKNTITKFYYSIFSRTGNISLSSGSDVPLKLPFLVYYEELISLNRSDIRTAGFGVYFSGIFIISIIILIYIGIIKFKTSRNKLTFWVPVVIIFTSLLLVLIISESWWARYTPFVYFIPLICLTILAASNKKMHKTLLTILMVIMYANLSFYINNNIIYNYREAENFRYYLYSFSNTPKTMHLSGKDEFLGLLYTLDDYNIKYDFKPKPKDKQSEKLFKFMEFWSD